MVTTIPNVKNWSVTPQNGELNYFTLMNTWLSESTAVIASLNNAINAQNIANEEINQIALNAIEVITLDTIEDLATYEGNGLVFVKDINRGGNFIAKTVNEIDPNTGSLYVVNNGTVFAKLGGGFWVRQYSGAVNVKWFGENPYFNQDIATFANAVKITDDEESVHLHLFGKVYQSEGTIEGDYKGTFLHTYRPMLPFPTDGSNTFLGGRAGNLTMSPDNTAIGNYLIHSSYNTGIGTQALGALTTGYNNTGVGVNAGRYNTQGYGSTFIGRDSGHHNTTGFYNTAIGQGSLFSNTTGNYSTALGTGALNSSNSSSNTAIGYRALFNVTSGVNNIGIGDNSGLGITTGSNNTIIGKDINIGDVSNTVVIGAGSIKRIFIDSAGKIGFNGVAPTAPLEYVTSEVTAYNPTATDGQLGNGAGLYLYQVGSSANAIAQIVMRPRGGQPFNRIVSSGGATPFMAFCTNNSERLRITQNGHIHPYLDNSQTLGDAPNRFSVVYAGTGTINTSDAREKTFLSIDDAEKQVAIELKELMKKFKFNDAIESKGEDKARIHFGTSAQEVISVFEKHGLNAMDYAMVCYDEWEDVYEQITDEDEILNENVEVIQEVKYKNGALIRPAGNRYGIRYEELLCFIISAM